MQENRAFETLYIPLSVLQQTMSKISVTTETLTFV